MKFQAILSLDAALAAVQNNGYALQYVKDQTAEIALAAVSRNGDALRYVLCKDLFLKIAAQLSIKVEI